jgi:uncharacterized protein YbjT (DUF2867 family)
MAPHLRFKGQGRKGEEAPLKVAVVGGTGGLGRLVVSELVERGDEVLALSRSEAALPRGASHRRVDLSDGEGLTAGVDGVEVVIDASNAPPAPRDRAREVLVEGSKRLLRAERETGVRHHVAVSIVGCDRVPMAYYGSKVAQEEAVASGPVPWSLLRATQFHSLLDWAFAGAARFGVVPTGRAPIQPVDPAIVASRLAGAAHAEPGGRLPDIAGPEVRTLTELAKAWRRIRGRRLLPLRIPMAGRTGRALRDGGLCEPGAAVGSPSFEQWLRESRGAGGP